MFYVRIDASLNFRLTRLTFCQPIITLYRNSMVVLHLIDIIKSELLYFEEIVERLIVLRSLLFIPRINRSSRSDYSIRGLGCDQDSTLKLNSRSRNERLITYYLAANPCKEEQGNSPLVSLTSTYRCYVVKDVGKTEG